MLKNKEDLEKKITDILSKGYTSHYILKKVLQDEKLYVNNKDIIDVIFIPRNSTDESSGTTPAKLLIATNYGILFLQEGFKEITDNYLGYKMKKIYYNKIDSLELDICLLEGEFRMNTGGKEDFVVTFNTSTLYNQFEEFISVIHKKIIKNYC